MRLSERDHKGNARNIRNGIYPREKITHVHEMSWDKSAKIEIFGKAAIHFIKDKLNDSKYFNEDGVKFFASYDQHYYDWSKTPDLTIQMVIPADITTDEKKKLVSGVKSYIASNIGLKNPKENSKPLGLYDTHFIQKEHKKFNLTYTGDWITDISKNENFAKIYDKIVRDYELEKSDKEEKGLNFADEFRSTWASIKPSESDRKKMQEYFDNYNKLDIKFELDKRSSYVNKCLHSIKNFEKYLSRIKIAEELGWTYWTYLATSPSNLNKWFDSDLEANVARRIISGKMEESKEMNMNIYEAKHKLRQLGYKLIKETTEDEETKVVNIYIAHETVKKADMSTSAGRRIYHMNAKAFGLREAREDDGSQRMGSSTVGMNHYSAEKKDSWTWIDFAAIQEVLSEYNISATEQHTQAKVTRDCTDEPVARWGHYGAYGENSDSEWYFSTLSERTWVLKLTGKKEAFETFDEEYDIEALIKENIPGYQKSYQGYDIQINVK